MINRQTFLAALALTFICPLGVNVTSAQTVKRASGKWVSPVFEATLQKLQIKGTLLGVDDETIGPDEKKTRKIDSRHDFLRPSLKVPTKPNRATGHVLVGGELRGETRLERVTQYPDGALDILIGLKLYEGSSEWSKDLDGKGSVNLSIPNNGTKRVVKTVQNQDEGGDYIRLEVEVSNTEFTSETLRSEIYIANTSGDLHKQTKENLAKNAKRGKAGSLVPTRIWPRTVNGKIQYVHAWQRLIQSNVEAKWNVSTDKSKVEFDKINKSLKSKGYRLFSKSEFTINGQTKYCGVWHDFQFGLKQPKIYSDLAYKTAELKLRLRRDKLIPTGIKLSDDGKHVFVSAQSHSKNPAAYDLHTCESGKRAPWVEARYDKGWQFHSISANKNGEAMIMYKW